MNKITFVESGYTRLGRKVVCKICGKDFFDRINGKQECCSNQCRSQTKKTGKMIKCSFCKKEKYLKLFYIKKSKSGLFFCNTKCHSDYMRNQYATGKILKKDKRISKKIYKETHCLENLYCSRCGYNEFDCGIDIHHIDENNKNNNIKNLIALCAPCHRALHSKLWKLEDLP